MMTQITWSTQKRKLSELKPAKYNPRKWNEKNTKSLIESLEKFSLADPIIINLNNTVIGGHFRLHILKQKFDSDLLIDVRVPNRPLSEDEEKELNLRLNKNSGEWDFDLLKDFGKEMLTEVGFDDLDLDKIFPVIIDAEEDDFDVDGNLPEEPTTKKGDVWSLGRHRVMCGDSTIITDVEKLMNGQKADLFITDPPYNVNYTGKTKDALKIENDQNEDSDFRQFLIDAFQSANIVMKEGAVFYIWHADSEGYNFRGACFDIGWKVRQCLIWLKNSMVMGRQDYHWKHEPCLYGWKEGASHLWASDRKQTTILNFDKPQRNAEHPTMKPIKLFDYQIQNNTKGSDIVLDLFAGSGTTVIACEQNKRTAYVMELDPKYVDVIVERWENLTGQKAVLL